MKKNTWVAAACVGTLAVFVTTIIVAEEDKQRPAESEIPAAVTPADIPAAAKPIKKVEPKRAAELGKLIKELEAIPAEKRTVADYLKLSAAYYELGYATFAVRNANHALEMDRNNEESYVALIKAQCVNLHEVVYAEENYQFAKKKFPHSEKIEALNLELFYGQMKFGQPFVAAKHLNSLLDDSARHLGESPDKEKSDSFLKTAEELVTAFERGRAPESALAKVQTKLEELAGKLPGDASKGLDPIVKQVADFRQELLKRYQAIRESNK